MGGRLLRRRLNQPLLDVGDPPPAMRSILLSRKRERGWNCANICAVGDLERGRTAGASGAAA